MDYLQSLDYLYGLQRFGIKLGLGNMQALFERLPELRQPLRCVHVAGTNGKGSVSAMLAEILRHAGLRTGLYTSPHLHCFTERIRIDGQPISRDEMVELTDVIRTAADDIPLTFFEAATAVGLLAFHRHQVDFAVIETGLGGRLDATNIVDPALCLITPISMDHQEHLGCHLEQIACEKAGIIKFGVPVIAGRQAAEVEDVLMKVAMEKEASFSLAGRDYDWQTGEGGVTVRVGDQVFSGLTTALAGDHQKDNLAQAVAAACALKSQGLVIPASAVQAAGRTVHWPARLEWWPGEQRLLLDAAHNRAGCDCLADYLVQQGLHKVRMVVGLSGERRPEDVLAPLQALMEKVYLAPVPGVGTVPMAMLSAWAAENGVPYSVFDEPCTALSAAVHDAAESDDVIVVCGSLYLVAAVREALLKFPDPTNDVVGFC